MAVIELRGLSQDIGDPFVGVSKLAENGGFCLHGNRWLGLVVESGSELTIVELVFESAQLL